MPKAVPHGHVYKSHIEVHPGMRTHAASFFAMVRLVLCVLCHAHGRSIPPARGSVATVPGNPTKPTCCQEARDAGILAYLPGRSECQPSPALE